jgi:hypothetical protein
MLLIHSGCCLQVLLVLVALVAVPIMLLPKPLILKKRFEKRQADLAQYGRIARHDMDEEGAGLRVAAAHSEEEEEFDFGEIMVHQVRLHSLRSLFSDPSFCLSGVGKGSGAQCEEFDSERLWCTRCGYHYSVSLRVSHTFKL